MKPYRQQQQLRPKKNRFVIGREAVLNALETGKALEKIYLQTEANGPGIDAIRAAASKAEVPINKVPGAKLRSLNLENHQGCVALISNVHYQNLQDLISFVVENGETPLLLMLDGITDVRNIGAIARTAFCCGVHGIIIPDKGVGALNEVAMETSAGALMQIPICRVNSLMKAVDELHLNGIKVFASEMKAPTPVGQLSLSEPCAIVMGSEDKGIYPALEKICDQSFSIPMPGEFESLNVSVATGMILYEAVKQRLGN